MTYGKTTCIAGAFVGANEEFLKTCTYPSCGCKVGKEAIVADKDLSPFCDKCSTPSSCSRDGCSYAYERGVGRLVAHVAGAERKKRAALLDALRKPVIVLDAAQYDELKNEGLLTDDYEWVRQEKLP